MEILCESVREGGLFPVSVGGRSYLFDAITVRVFEVDALWHDVILAARAERRDALQSVCERHGYDLVGSILAEIDSKQKNGTLGAGSLHRVNPFPPDRILHELNHCLDSICLSVTTGCNLGCGYCIYGGGYDRHEALTARRMSWETARKAIDFMVAKGDLAERYRIDFFGGEPLLAIDLIRKSIEYLRASTDKPVVYTIATNGTLLSEDVIDYFEANDVYVQVSLDISKQHHDQNRTYKGKDRRGSYDDIYLNLKRMANRGSWYQSRVKLKSVLTYNHIVDGNDIHFDPVVRDLYERNAASIVFQEPNFDVDRDQELFRALAFITRKAEGICGKNAFSDVLGCFSGHQRNWVRYLVGGFISMMKVNNVADSRARSHAFLKGCLPGRECVVDVDGSISVCNKSKSFVIGSVHTGGWDLERVLSVGELLYKPQARCETCICRSMCHLCYEKLDAHRLESSWAAYCQFNRSYFDGLIRFVLTLFAQNDLWYMVEEAFSME